MGRQLVTGALAMVVIASVSAAPGKIKQHGRAIVEYRSDDVDAVASYEYSQRNHGGRWLLIEFAVKATPRIAVHRQQFSLIRPDEQAVPLASQEQFLEDHSELTQLMQNARTFRHPLSSFFTSPTVQTIRFFASPGTVISDSAVTNLDEVAAGDLLFKSPDTRWDPGDYRLVLRHDRAMAELPIRLN